MQCLVVDIALAHHADYGRVHVTACIGCKHILQ